MLSDPVLFIKLILSYFSASWLSYLEPASFSDNQCKFSLKLVFCLWVLCVIFRLHGISTFPFTLPCAIRHLTLLNINFRLETLLLLVSMTLDEMFSLFPHSEVLLCQFCWLHVLSPHVMHEQFLINAGL